MENFPSIDVSRAGFINARFQAANGKTSFFRNPAFLNRALKTIRMLPDKRNLSVLFHACSVGAEPYSFVIEGLNTGLFDLFDSVTIDATDVCQEFIDVAQAGEYESAALADFDQAQSIFVNTDRARGRSTILESVRNRVRFLPAASFCEFKADRPYVVVFILNALCYVSLEEQQRAIELAARNTRSILCINAFHPDIIKPVLTAEAFEPMTRDLSRIYYGWRSRLRPMRPSRSDFQRYSWVLPWFPYFEAHSRYKMCSIFERRTPLESAK